MHPGPGHFRTFRDFAIFTHVADEEVEEEPYGCGQKQLRFVLFPGVRLERVQKQEKVSFLDSIAVYNCI